MQGIGIIVNEVAFLDHLVPLLQILDFPLLVCDPYLKELVEIYYPQVEVVVAQDYCLDPQLEGYDTYLYSEFYKRPTGYFQFGDFFSRRDCRSLFVFHGMGDKHSDLFWMEQLAGEDIVLLYGPQFYDKLKAKNIVNRIHKVIFCGNYRAAFQREKREPTKILYAPTWASPILQCDRRKHYSTVLEDYQHVVRELEGFDLTVKLHPYFEKLYPEEAAAMQKHFIPPPIYPLLEKTKILITDYSSIAYDFLYFKRPILLFGGEKPWAESVTKETLREKVEKAQSPVEEQEQAYRYAFGEFKSLEILKAEILNAT